MESFVSFSIGVSFILLSAGGAIALIGYAINLAGIKLDEK